MAGSRRQFGWAGSAAAQSSLRKVSISISRSDPIAAERNASVARRMIGAYFQLWTGMTARPDSRASARVFSSSTGSSNSGFSQRTFQPRARASSIGSPCKAGGVQMSTKSISMLPASSAIDSNVEMFGNSSRAILRRVFVRSTTATIFTSSDFRYPGEWPLAATAPKPIIAPRNTLLFRFELLEHPVDDLEGGIRLFDRQN